jgi:hypothetical protein
LRKLQFTLLLVGVAIVMCVAAAAVRLCCCQLKENSRIDEETARRRHHPTEISAEEDDANGDGRPEGQSIEQEHHPATAPSVDVARRKSPPLARSETFHGRVAAAWLDFRARVIHSILIVLCVFYLRITILLFSAFPCSLTADPSAPADSLAEPTQSLILDADGQTKCFSGEHAVALPFISLLLLLYTAGLPLGCFILLTRAFADEQTGGVIGRMWKRWACLRDSRARDKARLDASAERPQAWTHLPAQLSSDGEPGAAPLPTDSVHGGDLRHVRRQASTATARRMSKVAPSIEDRGVDGDVKGSTSLSLQPSSHADDPQQLKEQPERHRPPLQKTLTLSANQSAMALRTQLRRELLYGFLFLSYREATFVTGPLLLLYSCCVAVVTVFTDPSSDGDENSSRLRLFLFGLLWTVQTLLTAHYLPYHSLLSNGKQVALGLAALAHTILMLGLQSGAGDSVYFIGLLILFAVVTAAVFLRRAWLKRHKPNWTRQKTNWMRTLQLTATGAEAIPVTVMVKATLTLEPGMTDSEHKNDEGALVKPNARGEGDADHLASPSRRYELQGSAMPEGAAMDLPSPSAASSSDVGASSPRDRSRPTTAALAAVRPASSSGVSIRVGTPSGQTMGGASSRARWSASPLYLPDPDDEAEGGVTGVGKPSLSLLVPPRLPMQPRPPASGSASPSGLLASSAGGRSPRRISGAVQLMPLHHRRTASAATAATVKIHLPPIVSAPVPIERPASAEPAALSSISAAATATTDEVHSTVTDGSSAASLSPGSLPPLRKPPRILLLPVPRFAAATSPPSSSPSPRLPAAAAAAVIDAPPAAAMNSFADPSSSVVLHRPPSLIDVDGVLDEFEQQQVNQAHAHELERTKQMQKARRAKEQRKRAKMEAAAAAAAVAAVAASERPTSEAIAAESSPPVQGGAVEASAPVAASAEASKHGGDE